MADWEKEHIVAAFRFELGKVNARQVRKRTIEQLARVDRALATAVAEGLGLNAPTEQDTPRPVPSPALSLENNRGDGSIATRQVATLISHGADTGQADAMRDALSGQGAVVDMIAPQDGSIIDAEGHEFAVDRALPTVASVLYDAVLLPDGGLDSGDPVADDAALRFVANAYRHGKPIGALGSSVRTLADLFPAELRTDPNGGQTSDRGVVTGSSANEEFVRSFSEALVAHRHFDRPPMRRWSDR